MVECLLWEQDAAGSSPVASTIEKTVTERLLFFVLLTKKSGYLTSSAGDPDNFYFNLTLWLADAHIETESCH